VTAARALQLAGLLGGALSFFSFFEALFFVAGAAAALRAAARFFARPFFFACALRRRIFIEFLRSNLPMPGTIDERRAPVKRPG
jgi:hypothetical protein